MLVSTLVLAVFHHRHSSNWDIGSPATRCPRCPTSPGLNVSVLCLEKQKPKNLQKRNKKSEKSKTFSEKLEKTKVCCYVASGSHVATGFARASPDAASSLAGLRHGLSLSPLPLPVLRSDCDNCHIDIIACNL